MPGNAGSSAGWVLTKRSPNRARNAGPTSFMKPAETTRSGSCSATAAASAASQAARSAKSGTATTNVGTRACSALVRAVMPGRSAPTATTGRPVGRVGAGVEQGLQVGAGARDQDDDPPGTTGRSYRDHRGLVRGLRHGEARYRLYARAPDAGSGTRDRGAQ